MFNLIFKNIWARRKRNGWLFAELIAVAIVSWVIFDPVVVGLYVRNLPTGYDVDRLCRISLGRYYEGASEFSAEADSTLFEDIDRIMYQARNLNNVESSTQLLGFAYPGSMGNSNSTYVNPNDTTKLLRVTNMYYKPRTDFFKTFGIQPADGYTVEQLEEAVLSANSTLLSEDGARYLYGDNRSDMRLSIPPQYLSMVPDWKDRTVTGVFKSFKMNNGNRAIPVAFYKFSQDDNGGTDVPAQTYILVRVKEGVNLDKFIDDFNQNGIKQLHSGNLYARSIMKFSSVMEDRDSFYLNAMRMRYVLAAFFMISLCLGVIGTFWLQTKVRKEDIGVMLSFGGTPKTIMGMLMGEGVLLTTIAVVIGCLIYMQYGISEGLVNDYMWGGARADSPMVADSWIDSFPQHFLIVSGIIWLIMTIVVLIGIFIPAHKISHVQPTEALRDE
ncbi:MAG: ABC transporter permease [Bacteroidaceae bacterium]|nr:ABC transporter permease [Bacteroidaceae bacterium]